MARLTSMVLDRCWPGHATSLWNIWFVSFVMDLDRSTSSFSCYCSWPSQENSTSPLRPTISVPQTAFLSFKIDCLVSAQSSLYKLAISYCPFVSWPASMRHPLHIEPFQAHFVTIDAQGCSHSRPEAMDPLEKTEMHFSRSELMTSPRSLLGHHHKFSLFPWSEIFFKLQSLRVFFQCSLPNFSAQIYSISHSSWADIRWMGSLESQCTGTGHQQSKATTPRLRADIHDFDIEFRISWTNRPQTGRSSLAIKCNGNSHLPRDWLVSCVIKPTYHGWTRAAFSLQFKRNENNNSWFLWLWYQPLKARKGTGSWFLKWTKHFSRGKLTVVRNQTPDLWCKKDLRTYQATQKMILETTELRIQTIFLPGNPNIRGWHGWREISVQDLFVKSSA
jgi:hypothetical protein